MGLQEAQRAREEGERRRKERGYDRRYRDRERYKDRYRKVRISNDKVISTHPFGAYHCSMSSFGIAKWCHHFPSMIRKKFFSPAYFFPWNSYLFKVNNGFLEDMGQLSIPFFL